MVIVHHGGGKKTKTSEINDEKYSYPELHNSAVFMNFFLLFLFGYKEHIS
jgi:hypothetical protein